MATMEASLPLGVAAKGRSGSSPPEPGPLDGPGHPPDRAVALSGVDPAHDPQVPDAVSVIHKPAHRRWRRGGWLPHRRDMTPLLSPLVVVIGASGGLGASTWSAALARRLSLHLGECVLVDADLRGGGLDMTCGIEHVPGLRWPDLARLRGTTSAERLVAALPHGEVPVLSAGGHGAAVSPGVVVDVLASLRGVVPLVLDVPARGRSSPGS